MCMYSTALVFEETFAITAFAVVSCAVLRVKSWVCAIAGAHFLGLVARNQRDISADCSCSCKLRCCRAECVLFLGFNVQYDIFEVTIAWS